MTTTQSRWNGWSRYVALAVSCTPLVSAWPYMFHPERLSKDFGVPYSPVNDVTLAHIAVLNVAIGAINVSLGLTRAKKSFGLTMVAAAFSIAAQYLVVALLGSVNVLTTASVLFGAWVYALFAHHWVYDQTTVFRWTGWTYYAAWLATVSPLPLVHSILSTPAQAAEFLGLPYTSTTRGALTMVAVRLACMALIGFLLLLAQDRKSFGVALWTVSFAFAGVLLVLHWYDRLEPERAGWYSALGLLAAGLAYACMAGESRSKKKRG